MIKIKNEKEVKQQEEAVVEEVKQEEAVETKKNKTKTQELKDYVVCVKKINVSDCEVLVDNKEIKTLSELPRVFLIKKAIFEKPENTMLKNRVEVIKAEKLAIF